MYAYNVPEHVLGQIAQELGFELDSDTQYDRKRVRFTLKLKEGDKYRKLSPNAISIEWFNNHAESTGWKWRRTSSVCFHGHYAFFEKLFELAPAAIVTSNLLGKVRYEGCDNAWRTVADELGRKRLGKEGNIYHSLQIRDCCNCEEVKK